MFAWKRKQTKNNCQRHPRNLGIWLAAKGPPGGSFTTEDSLEWKLRQPSWHRRMQQLHWTQILKECPQKDSFSSGMDRDSPLCEHMIVWRMFLHELRKTVSRRSLFANAWIMFLFFQQRRSFSAVGVEWHEAHFSAVLLKRLKVACCRLSSCGTKQELHLTTESLPPQRRYVSREKSVTEPRTLSTDDLVLNHCRELFVTFGSLYVTSHKHNAAAPLVLRELQTHRGNRYKLQREEFISAHWVQVEFRRLMLAVALLTQGIQMSAEELMAFTVR